MRRNAKFPLFKAAHRPRQSRQRLKLGSSAVAFRLQGHRDRCLDAEAARIQKIVEIPQLQYTDEKVDITDATELGPGRLRPAFVTELGPTELGSSELGPSELGPVLSFKG